MYAVGGAQAIAMFAYGTADCAPVDLVTGPGNVYVAAAKRLLSGLVGIDAEAGPTEIAILADDTADPDFVAADLVAQAEHDPQAACLLVTRREPGRRGRRRAGRRRSQPPGTRARRGGAGRPVGIVLVDDLDAGLAVVDAWAAEHLEIQTRDAAAVAARVRNAGAIFVGPYAPVSLGDYLAGSNHVLPTGGTARHTSGLSVQSFLRGDPRRRLRPRRAGRGRRSHRRPWRRRGPAPPTSQAVRSRIRRPMSRHEPPLPLRDDLRGMRALRRPAARRRRPR